jgi:hypothetical protein
MDNWPNELSFLGDVFSELALDRYENATNVFFDGLKKLLVSKTGMTEADFTYYLRNPLVGFVKSKLSQHLIAGTPPINDQRGEMQICSFCGKGEKHVNQLIAGPGCYICDSCITNLSKLVDRG